MGEPGLLLACGASVSGEQKASHFRGGPFPLASDFVDEEESPPKPMTLNRLGRMMAEGFNHVSASIDELRKEQSALATRVASVEADADWKRLFVKWGKPLAMAAGGALAAKFPEVAKFLLALATGAP